MSLSADEVVVPVAIIGAADEAPYRKDGHSFISVPNVVAGVAGQFSYGSISGPTSGRALIRGFVASATTAGQGSLLSGNGFVAAGAITPADVEDPQLVGNTTYPGLGLRVNGVNSAATPAGNELWRFELLTTLQVFTLPVPVVLPADPLGSGTIQLYIRPNTVLFGLTFQWFGQVFEF